MHLPIADSWGIGRIDGKKAHEVHSLPAFVELVDEPGVGIEPLGLEVHALKLGWADGKVYVFQVRATQGETEVQPLPYDE